MVEFGKTYFVEELKHEDPMEWVIEGYEWAVNAVYSGIKEGEKPSEAYLVEARRVCRVRLALAGYRLAKEFTKILQK